MLADLVDPTSDQEAATKAYVDTQVNSAVEAKLWKDPVVAASTSDVNIATTVANGDSLDGVTLATGDRILLKNQSVASENGIWVVAASGAPARADDMSAVDEVTNATVLVTEGTVNGGLGFTSTSAPAVIDVNDIAFVNTQGVTVMTAGDGLSRSGKTMSVDANQDGVITSATSLVAVGALASGSIAAGFTAIADARLDTISTSNKVSGSAVQLASTTALQNTSGLLLKTALAGDGLAMTSQVLSVNVDGVGVELSSDALRLKDSGVVEAKIADEAVVAAKLAANAVTEAKILDANVTAGKIADGAIAAAKLATDAVIEAKIADEAVTNDKIADDTIDMNLMMTYYATQSAGADMDIHAGTSLSPSVAFDANRPAGVIAINIDGLPALGADRTIKLPYATSSGKHLTVMVRNADGANKASFIAQVGDSILGDVPDVLAGTEATFEFFTIASTVWMYCTAAVEDGSLTAAKIASDAVSTAKILDANVTAAKLAAGAVTGAKIQKQLLSVSTDVGTADLQIGTNLSAAYNGAAIVRIIVDDVLTGNLAISLPNVPSDEDGFELTVYVFNNDTAQTVQLTAPTADGLSGSPAALTASSTGKYVFLASTASQWTYFP